MKNRLISFTDAADTGIYTYDTAGRRLSKTYGGSTTEYLYCTTCRYAQVLEERDDLGNITAEYYIGNDLISREDGAQELSYLYDGHGSVRKLINEYGGVPAQYSYDAYGILLESSGPSSENNEFRYSGEQYDPHLDQYYLRARYYNQNVGRFHTMDDWQGVLSRPLSLNKYNYTESNPVMGRDPSGRFMIGGLMAMLAVGDVMSQTAIPSYLQNSGKFFIWVYEFGSMKSPTYGASITLINGNKTISVKGSSWPNYHKKKKHDGWPEKLRKFPGVQSGTYFSRYSWKGHKNSTLPGVRLRDGYPVPTLAPNPEQNFVSLATGVNLHCGISQTNRGSANCITIKPDECSNFWKKLDENQKGYVTIFRSAITDENDEMVDFVANDGGNDEDI